jgi:hypothetical protein
MHLDPERVLEILLDKGLLALILLVFGFVLKRALERYKRDQAILLALGKTRADATLEVLAQAARVNGTALSVLEKKPDDSDASARMKRATEEVTKLKVVLDKHRFLIGKYYELCFFYVHIQNFRIKGWYNRKPKEVESLTKDLKLLDHEMERMLDEGPTVRFSIRVRWLLFSISEARAMARDELN